MRRAFEIFGGVCQWLFDRGIVEYAFWFIIAVMLAMSLPGCSAFNQPMRPPIRSSFEAWDRGTGDTEYFCEPYQIRSRGGVVEVKSFSSGRWRAIRPGCDWDARVNPTLGR